MSFIPTLVALRTCLDIFPHTKIPVPAPCPEGLKSWHDLLALQICQLVQTIISPGLELVAQRGETLNAPRSWTSVRVVLARVDVGTRLFRDGVFISASSILS